MALSAAAGPAPRPRSRADWSTVEFPIAARFQQALERASFAAAVLGYVAAEEQRA